MTDKYRLGLITAIATVCATASLGGCSTVPTAPAAFAGADDRACLTRAMYFESDRSSDKGLRAVGTVVMNRVASPQFPKTICGVVGQPGQFAAGVLSDRMRPEEQERIARIADQILSGQREAAVGDAMFFHRAGLTFPYKNMHYVLVAGGNAFYDKHPATKSETRIAMAHVHPTPTTIDDLIVLANSAPLQLDPSGVPK